jgi:hypothetical protein
LLIIPEIRIHDADLDGVFQQLQPPVDTKLAGDTAAVLFNRFGADAKDVGDRLGGLSFNDKPENLLFALRQKIISSDRGLVFTGCQIGGDNISTDSGA